MPQRRRLLFQMHLRQFLHRIAFERQPSGDHLEQRHAETVHIASRIQLLSPELFRTHIRRTPGNLHILGPFGLVHSESEVGQFYDSVLRDHNIIGLHIPMDQSGLVPRVVERLRDLLDDLNRRRGFSPPCADGFGDFPR